MRHKPSSNYNGLTIVLSNPSRFDQYELLSGTAGHYFKTECLTCSSKQCDIRTSNTLGDGLLSGTKAILLLGERGFKQWSDLSYKDYSLNEQRGCIISNPFKLPCIASYFPQDAIDILDYEKKFNPQESFQDDDSAFEDEEEGEEGIKRKGRTKRSNYRFWLRQDTRKLCGILESGIIPSPDYVRRIAPSSAEIIQFLDETRDKFLYLDIETTVEGGYNLLCIGIATDDSPVYVIPIFRYNGILHYNNLPHIFKALSRAFEYNTLVTHNGFGFDLLILCWRYGIPISKNQYDTMVAHHRCFPEVEKSLGHCLSLWTFEPYHKDEGIFTPQNNADERKLWEYNSKDVNSMRLIKRAIDNYARKIPGLEESIRQGNNCIYPYTLCSLCGINFDDDKRNAIISRNDRLLNQYLRILKLIKGDYEEDILPTSSPSCVKYFHDYLHYEVVGRSRRISKKTGKPLNNPSLDEKNMRKLKLKYPENIILDVCLRYRAVKKESSMLQFEPWDFQGLPK